MNKTLGWIVALILLCCGLSMLGSGQQATPTPQPAPTPQPTPATAEDQLQPLAKEAPPDKPQNITANEKDKFEKSIVPYVEKARASLPDVKARFLKGLGKGEVLFVTIRLYDEAKRYEQVFVEVKSWKDSAIRGLLANDTPLLKGHKRGEKLEVEEKDVLDWTIAKPDGSEEGNFVGKFLDSRH